MNGTCDWRRGSNRLFAVMCRYICLAFEEKINVANLRLSYSLSELVKKFKPYVNVVFTTQTAGPFDQMLFSSWSSKRRQIFKKRRTTQCWRLQPLMFCGHKSNFFMIGSGINEKHLLNIIYCWRNTIRSQHPQLSKVCYSISTDRFQPFVVLLEDGSPDCVWSSIHCIFGDYVPASVTDRKVQADKLIRTWPRAISVCVNSCCIPALQCCTITF